jgi:hypothetical protein
MEEPSTSGYKPWDAGHIPSRSPSPSKRQHIYFDEHNHQYVPALRAPLCPPQPHGVGVFGFVFDRHCWCQLAVCLSVCLSVSVGKQRVSLFVGVCLLGAVDYHATHVHKYAHRRTCVHTHTHTDTHTHTYTHAYVYTRTRTCTHMHTCTSTQAHAHPAPHTKKQVKEQDRLR